MHTLCMVLAFISLCAPAKPYSTEYSRAESEKAYAKMVFCARHAAALPADAKNATYSRCLVALAATI